MYMELDKWDVFHLLRWWSVLFEDMNYLPSEDVNLPALDERVWDKPLIIWNDWSITLENQAQSENLWGYYLNWACGYQDNCWACTDYQNRPEVCRNFDVWSSECLTARKFAGIID